MMSKTIHAALRRLTFGLLAATVLAGCSRPRMAETTTNGVKFQIAGSATGKTKVRMDGTKMFINDNYYGTAQSGDTVVVSDTGVTVNGSARPKQSAP